MKRLVSAAFVLLLGTAAFGERYPLPARTSLDRATVSLELSDADVTVVVDDSAEPVIAVDALPAEADGAAIEADLRSEVLRIAPIDGPMRLQVDLRLRTDQSLALGGRQISLRVRRVPNEAATPAVETEVSAGGSEPSSVALDLRLEASEVDLDRTGETRITASDTSLWIRDTEGALYLDLRRGSATIRRHSGSVEVDGAETSIEVLDQRGDITARCEGGDLRIDGGSGQIQLNLQHTDAAVSLWRGKLHLVGEGGRFEARDVERSPDGWVVEGSDLQAFVERVAGSLEARLTSGSLDVRDLGGSLKLEGSDGLEATAESLRGDVSVQLSGGATARLTQAERQLLVKIEDSLLEADDVRRLNLEGTRSELRLSGIKRVERVQLVDSSLTADLSEVRSRVHLELAGQGDATVWLGTPCVVAVRTSDPERAGQVRVVSCDLRLPGQPLRPARNRLIHGHRVPVILNLTIDEGVRVVAEGRTVE
ncbi:MAG: DUF4097 domain-containing protein [Thermoanaerobaculia bacterium]|nr:DUF4097 domain-containing protein [Thermoanaerobaculia bacterium]